MVTPLSGVVFHDVSAEQGALIVDVAIDLIERTGRATRIGEQVLREGVDADRDGLGFVVANVVADEHRLRAADENRCRQVGSASRAIDFHADLFNPIGVVFDDAVREPEFGLVHFDHVEVDEGTFDPRVATAERDQRVFNVRASRLRDVEATPVARRGHDVRAVVGRIE